MKKIIPFTKDQIQPIIEKFGTPFYIYDEAGIRSQARKLIDAFAWAPGFKEYFAVKATPNPAILEILKSEGCGTDCSSLPELLLSEKIGVVGENIMFTSNDTPADEFQKAKALGAIINLDDITHIEFLEKCAGLPEVISFRYNPGSARVGNSIIGQPIEAKFGLTKEQIFEAYKIVRAKGVKRFGLHTMVASNELNSDYFVQTAQMLFDLVLELKEKNGIDIEFVNLGGGLGVPYKPDQTAIDLNFLSAEIKKLYEKMGFSTLKIFMESGRFITGPNGYLVSKVRHFKNIYKQYVGLDATMANLMRPGMYGAYHHITVMGKEDAVLDHVYDVTGSLCENNDKFAIDRSLPKIEIGDVVVIHDAGAHGHAMGFNYNGKLRSAEFLLQKDGQMRMIRRAETLDDYFATLEF